MSSGQNSPSPSLKVSFQLIAECRTIDNCLHLVYAHVKTVQFSECKSQYADFVSAIPGDVYIGSNVLCAGDNTTDACSGQFLVFTT